MIKKKFEKVTLKNDVFLDFVVNQEKRIDTIFKNLVDSNRTSKEMPKFVKPVGIRPGIMYGNCKVHKQQVDGFLPSVYKFGMVFRYFRICSNWTQFHTELTFLNGIFQKNGYPDNFIDKRF